MQTASFTNIQQISTTNILESLIMCPMTRLIALRRYRSRTYLKTGGGNDIRRFFMVKIYQYSPEQWFSKVREAKMSELRIFTAMHF